MQLGQMLTTGYLTVRELAQALAQKNHQCIADSSEGYTNSCAERMKPEGPACNRQDLSSTECNGYETG